MTGGRQERIVAGMGLAESVQKMREDALAKLPNTPPGPLYDQLSETVFFCDAYLAGRGDA